MRYPSPHLTINGLTPASCQAMTESCLFKLISHDLVPPAILWGRFPQLLSALPCTPALPSTQPSNGEALLPGRQRWDTWPAFLALHWGACAGVRPLWQPSPAAAITADLHAEGRPTPNHGNTPGILWGRFPEMW